LKLSEICIRRPVFATVLSLILIVIGIIYCQQLTIRELPTIQKPVVTITTRYPGASAELVESAITTPIENALSGLSGLESMSSTSKRERSQITLYFTEKISLNSVMEDVRNDLGELRNRLPVDAKSPIAEKNDADEAPSLILAVLDDTHSKMAVTDYLKRNVLPQIQQIDGVGSVYMWGQRNYAIHIWLDAAKMAAHNVAVSDIAELLKNQDVNIASGEITNADRSYTLLTHVKLESVAQFGNLVVRQDDNKPIHLSDVARIEVAPEIIDQSMRVDGKPAIGIEVIPQALANPLEVFQTVNKRLLAIQKSLPNGMYLHVIYDNSFFIKESLKQVYQSLLEAFILVIVVIWLFLGSLRSALIPIVTIPVCLLAVFWPMYLLGFSINLITLMALVLAIGLVVDDAIVMLENIHRHIETGESPLQAAIKGSREIGFAIIAMTLTLAAVYTPTLFAQGFTGAIFRPFGLTLALAVIISGFIALTLTPMMCSKLLKHSSGKQNFSAKLDRVFTRLANNYRRYLAWQLSKRRWVFLGLALMMVLGVFLYRSLPNELAPKEDSGVIFSAIKPPTDASFSYMDRYMHELEAIFDTVPEREHMVANVGLQSASKAFAILTLKPWQERKRSQQQIIASLEEEVKKIPGIQVFLFGAQLFGNSRNNEQTLKVIVMTSGSYSELNQLLQFLKGQLEKLPQFKQVDSDLQINSQRFELMINRDLAAQLKVNIKDIGDTIATMVGGKNPMQFEYQGQDYPVIMQLQDLKRQDLTTLQALTVRSQTGNLVPLSNLVVSKETIAPTALEHHDRQRAAGLSIELNPTYSLGDGVKQLQQLLPQLLPDNAKFEFVGNAKQYLESSSHASLIFLLAIVFIYLVLCAQFESFIDPLVILLTVPLCIVGALLTLKLLGGGLSIYVNIAMVTLIGLITKHGILITEFANQMRQQGKSLQHAIIDAASLRLRPILMTTAAMVLGALPLAFASGASAASRQQVGWVIVGGMLLGTLFSLIVVPVAYTLLSRKPQALSN
jgi:multidrug efflux pump